MAQLPIAVELQQVPVVTVPEGLHDRRTLVMEYYPITVQELSRLLPLVVVPESLVQSLPAVDIIAALVEYLSTRYQWGNYDDVMSPVHTPTPTLCGWLYLLGEILASEDREDLWYIPTNPPSNTGVHLVVAYSCLLPYYLATGGDMHLLTTTSTNSPTLLAHFTDVLDTTHNPGDPDLIATIVDRTSHVVRVAHYLAHIPLRDTLPGPTVEEISIKYLFPSSDFTATTTTLGALLDLLDSYDEMGLTEDTLKVLHQQATYCLAVWHCGRSVIEPRITGKMSRADVLAHDELLERLSLRLHWTGWMREGVRDGGVLGLSTALVGVI